LGWLKLPFPFSLLPVSLKDGGKVYVNSHIFKYFNIRKIRMSVRLLGNWPEKHSICIEYLPLAAVFAASSFFKLWALIDFSTLRGDTLGEGFTEARVGVAQVASAMASCVVSSSGAALASRVLGVSAGRDRPVFLGVS
jgi:hypothetical protein